jgi:hypothetical protein
MRRWISFTALVAAFALASWLGWWAVPAVAALWGVLRPRVAAPAGLAALAASLAWGAWLIADWAAGHGGFGTLAARLGGVMNLPAFVLILLTLLLAALLAWSSAVLAGAVAHSLAPRSGGTR